MTVFGWDASDFDWDRGPMDFGAARSAGVDFVTHKATEGTRTRHARYGEALRRARDAGVPVLGAYCVVRTPGGSHGSVAAQVDYLLSYVDAQTPWWRTWPHWLWQVDLEHWEYDRVAPQHGVRMCELLARTGRRVVLYAPKWAYGNSIPGPWPLWASNYGTNPATGFRAAYPGDGSSRWAPYSGRTPVILQYGSRTVIGRQGTCDANAWRGSLAELLAWTALGPTDEEDEVQKDLWDLLSAILIGETPDGYVPAGHPGPESHVQQVRRAAQFSLSAVEQRLTARLAALEQRAPLQFDAEDRAAIVAALRAELGGVVRAELAALRLRADAPTGG